MGESPDKVRRDGETEEEVPTEQAGTESNGSTVQLRVRDVDSRTTMLRLPVDNATTMLRLPEEAAPEALTSPDTPDSPDVAEVAADEPVEPVDPRLAVRDARDEASEVAEAVAAEEPVVELRKPPVQVLTAPEPTVVPPAPLPAPETTSEAMEVLAALSARPVSPFRRGVKRVTVWTLFLAFVVGVVTVAQLLRPLPDPQVKLSLTKSYTFAGSPLALPWPSKGQAAAEVVGVGSLGSSGPETPAPIASVTKVMTAHLVLRAHPLKKGEAGPGITVDKQAADESANTDESRAQLTEGQPLTQFQALELLMLPSANNVARLLARWDAGSEAEFVKKMNDEAKALGMTSTTYADPAGYDSNTRSTAKDQLKLAGQVMKNDVFRQVVATPDMTHNGQRVYNSNALLSAKNGVIGVKTGSSTPAGSCLMWAAVKDVGGTRRLILGVTMGQPATATDTLLKAAQTASQKVITAAQDSLTGQTLATRGQVVGHVDDGLGGQIPVVATKDLTVAGWTGVTAQLTLQPESLGHSAKAGTQVGTISAGEGEGKVQVPVALQRDLAPPSILSRLLHIA